MWQSAILVSLLTVALLISAGNAEPIAESSCPATPKLEVVAAIAPAAGDYPVWVVDGSYGHWRGPEAPVKTAWIFARDNPGDLTVVARRLGGNGRALFKSSVTADLSDRLVIANADTQQMIPGGIEPDKIHIMGNEPVHKIDNLLGIECHIQPNFPPVVTDEETPCKRRSLASNEVR